MDDEIYLDPITNEVMINPNVDTIHLPKEVFDELREMVTEEIDKEILAKLRATRSSIGCVTHTDKR